MKKKPIKKRKAAARKPVKRKSRHFNIVMMGPQGSGKGTQANLLAQKFKIPHISTGEIFREMKKKDTPLGAEIRKLIDNGHMAPDELTNLVVSERLKNKDAKKGFILDGYPRSMSQAQHLENEHEVNFCIFLDVTEEEALHRIVHRRVCSLCHANYNALHLKPKKEGKCDRCGGTLITREDDKPQFVRLRLNKYHEATEPLVEFYEHKKVLIRIDGQQPIKKVFSEILKKL